MTWISKDLDFQIFFSPEGVLEKLKSFDRAFIFVTREKIFQV